MDSDLELRRRAETQHGLVTTAMATSLGLGRHQLRRMTASGRWERLSPRVLRLVGAPRTEEQGALAAVLNAGDAACLSVRSAVAWWDVPGFALRPHELSRPRNSTKRGGDGVAHEPRHLPPEHVTVRRGVPVTTPARTIVDLAGAFSPQRVERALDTLWARSLVSFDSLRSMVDELGGRGRPGTTTMRTLLAERSPDYIAPESRLERRFIDLLESAGEEPFDRQVAIGDERGRIGRVDQYDRSRRLVVEIDSWRFHSSPSDRRNDAIRDARLRAIGCTVHRVTEEDLLTRPADVLATIRALRRAADRAIAS